MGDQSSSTEIREHHHILEVFEVNRAYLHSMEQKIQTPPRLLQKSAGNISCCIFRVPQSLVEINPKAYEPHIVSIGPYHHGKEHLKMIEEHKWRFLQYLLSRTQSNGRCLEDYFKAVGLMEGRIRQSYCGDIEVDRDKFIEMMVLDGCFVIELFRIVEGLVPPVDDEDPLFTMQWICSFLMRDLIKLENQIPFFVLECLFDLSKEVTEPSLSLLALSFFNNALQRPDEVIERYRDLNAFHLLDLLRLSFIPTNEKPRRETSSSEKLTHCATKLYRNGIKFNVGKSDTILDIRFRNGVIEIPTVTIDDFLTSVFLNCIAFEQCHGSQTMYINTYAAFLGFLINSPEDVGLLRDYYIIENYYGTDEQVAKFFNDLGKDVSIDIGECYLNNLFEDINDYSRNTWNAQFASLKRTYFDTPWSFLSALAAVILLILTAAQTFFSAFGYFYPPS